jgi:hypothetical protein
MRVRFFAGAAEAAGLAELQVDASMTFGELRAALADEHGA